MKILLTGGSGQLGNSIIESKPKDINLISPNRSDLDLTDSKNCFKSVVSLKPDWIINCAAFTNVDQAELNKEYAFRINSKAPEAFAQALKITGGKIIQISTDYVFDGKQNVPYKNTDRKNPLSIYGMSKSEGEDLIIEEMREIKNYFILRTSWLSGDVGDNFVSKLLRLHSNKEEINMVSDQIGSPTTTFSLSKIIWEIIKKDQTQKNLFDRENRILHWSDQGIASWYDLAIAIGEIGLRLGIISRNAEIIPILSSELNNSFIRPRYSKLNCEYTKYKLNVKGIHWRDSLNELLKNRLR